MAIAGRVAIVPKGDWSANATYKRLDAVTHNNTLYFAKKDVPAGTETSNTEYWSKSVVGSAVIVDDALSSTSTNPVQNKVVTSNLVDLKYGEVAGGKNLLNPNKTIIGGLIEGIVTSGECYISDYIPIKSNTSYSISNCTQGSNEVAWYTSDKTYISRSFTTPVISPSNASYVRIEYTDNINAQLEEGSVATSYEPYIPSIAMLTDEKADKSETTVNLLNPTLQTSTQNGVTCTHNGDGTYTLNGTNTYADTTIYFTLSDTLVDLAKKMVNKKLKLAGCPAGGSDSTFDLQYEINSLAENGDWYDFGNGVVVNNYKIAAENITKCTIYIAVRPGATASNLVFKPMLTTNLSATYDDFVPYTGDTGKLNGDVAELKAKSVKKDDVVNNQTTTEEGFALDARQANPNVEGSLGAQIKAVNSSLNAKKVPIFSVENVITDILVYGSDGEFITPNNTWEASHNHLSCVVTNAPAGQTSISATINVPANSIVLLSVCDQSGPEIRRRSPDILSNIGGDSTITRTYNLYLKDSVKSTHFIDFYPLVIHLG